MFFNTTRSWEATILSLHCPMPLPKETKPRASLQQLTLEIPGYSKANAYTKGFVQGIQINQYGVNEPLKHTHCVPASGASPRLLLLCVCVCLTSQTLKGPLRYVSSLIIIEKHLLQKPCQAAPSLLARCLWKEGDTARSQEKSSELTRKLVFTVPGRGCFRGRATCASPVA